MMKKYLITLITLTSFIYSGGGESKYEHAYKAYMEFAGRDHSKDDQDDSKDDSNDDSKDDDDK